MPAGPFEPVLLDLSDDNDYFILVDALTDFAAQRECDADEECARLRIDRAGTPNFRELYLRAQAAAAHALIVDIERQIAANGEARRSISH